MPSNQETFDTVVAHLRRQGSKAQARDPTSGLITCLYRAPDGKRCAAGCLIPDNQYEPALELSAVGGISENNKYCSNEVTLLIEELGHDIELVGALQSMHDNSEVADWETKLEQLATDFGLRYIPLSENTNGPAGDIRR
jgi:hypothetical protein